MKLPPPLLILALTLAGCESEAEPASEETTAVLAAQADPESAPKTAC